jgi:hypothetical protein
MVHGKPKDPGPAGAAKIPESASSKTDQLDDSSGVQVVSASENGIGAVDHDERGHAKWKWSTEVSAPSSADTGTFDLLKALDNDSLTLSQEVPALNPTAVDKHAGYNPYEAVTERAPAKGFAGAKRNIPKPR